MLLELKIFVCRSLYVQQSIDELRTKIVTKRNFAQVPAISLKTLSIKCVVQNMVRFIPNFDAMNHKNPFDNLGKYLLTFNLLYMRFVHKHKFVLWQTHLKLV
jgi:hypothetical protein